MRPDLVGEKLQLGQLSDSRLQRGDELNQYNKSTVDLPEKNMI